jgi:Zn-dependent peptidase ImmA (M78 family)
LGSASRSRFDAAHELGHIVLHRQIDRTSFTRPAEFRQIEEQAHRFAAYFLLPPSSFVTDFYVPSLDALRALKSKWHVSIGMMLMHADRLDLISEHEKLRLWRSYARRGWKSTEPLDTEIPVEKPRMLRQCFELITSKQILSRDAILSMIPLNPSDIEELAGLPNGFCIGEELVTNLLSFPKKRGSAG